MLVLILPICRVVHLKEQDIVTKEAVPTMSWARSLLAHADAVKASLYPESLSDSCQVYHPICAPLDPLMDRLLLRNIAKRGQISA